MIGWFGRALPLMRSIAAQNQASEKRPYLRRYIQKRRQMARVFE
jgi:hypothetical protein